MADHGHTDGGNQKLGCVFLCRLVIQPEQAASGLEQKPQPLPYSQMLDLLEESVTEVIKADPQPFSQRKSMFSVSDMSSKVWVYVFTCYHVTVI